MKRLAPPACPDCGEPLIEQRSHGRNVGWCIRCGKEHKGPARTDVISDVPCVCKCGLTIEVTPAMRAAAEHLPLHAYLHGSHAKDGEPFLINQAPGATRFCADCILTLDMGWVLKRGYHVLAEPDRGQPLFHVVRAPDAVDVVRSGTGRLLH